MEKNLEIIYVLGLFCLVIGIFVVPGIIFLMIKDKIMGKRRNRHLFVDRPDSNILRKVLWHAGNVVFCSIIGLFLFALIPSLVNLGSRTILFGFSFAYIPFFIASIRSGKKNISIARHIVNSFTGCIIAYTILNMPFIEGKGFVSWTLIIVFGSLFAVSWISGKKTENAKKEDN